MFAELLVQRLSGIAELSPLQLAQLQAHYDLLARWNRRLNLTSLHQESDIVERHYCESIFLAIHLPPGPLSVADIGSGAGFPGFPVAIYRSDCSVTLIESHQRKAVFLREAAREIHNVKVVAKRAEEVKETFDWAISRAVKLDDIRLITKKLAKHEAFLMTDSCPSATSIRLPWGHRRFLCFT